MYLYKAINQPTNNEMKHIIQNGRIKWPDLRAIIPSTIQSNWNPIDSRYNAGFKYEWSDNRGAKHHIHGHSRDLMAPIGSHSYNEWTVSIRVRNKWLTTHATFIRNVKHYANDIHIPLDNYTCTNE